MKASGTESVGSNPHPAPITPGQGGKSSRNRNRGRNNIKTNSYGTDSGIVASGNSNSVKFTGTCTKDLSGVVIIYSPDTAIMSRQPQMFLPKVEEATGKISGAMGKSIKQQKALTMVDLVSSKLQSIPKSSYTVKDENGT